MQDRHAADLISEGRFHEAVTTLEKQFRSSPQTAAKDVFTYARALMALSRYDEAFNVLYLSMTDRDSKARAFGLQAEIRWIQHRYEEAYNLCLNALQLNLFNRRVQTIRNRCRQALEGTTREAVPGCEDGRRLGHAAFYVAPGGNFGDLALPPTIRAAVAHWKPVSEWTAFSVHQQFGAEQVAEVNKLDGLVIGGGGLFLPDTSPNGDSGWQWNIATEMLEAITVPIYVIAVGYNLFKGQQFYGDTFRKSLTALVRKAEVIGLRNSGSIAKVRSLLPEELRDKVRYMPCPTTILNRLDIGTLDDIDIAAARKRVFLNAAFDRSNLRFGETYPAFLDQMAKYVSSLMRSGISVELAAHLPRDEKLGEDLYDTYGLRLPVHGFYDMSCIEGYNLYRQAGVVVGMRGHATMIPFGLSVPVLSIVSHPKMQFFLDDIEQPHWGVQIDHPDFFGELYRATVDILERNEQIRSDLETAQDKLYDACQQTISLVL